MHQYMMVKLIHESHACWTVGSGLYGSTMITMEVNGYHQLVVTSVLQNIFFCAQQKKETQTGLEQVEEGE